MKKIFKIIICMFVILPITIFAETHLVKDLSIDIDSDWSVFTRDNIYNNDELNNMDISYDYMNQLMTANNIYLDAIKLKTPSLAELFVVIKSSDTGVIYNMHKYSKKEINELGNKIIERFGADKFDVVEVGKYKYIHFNYYDKTVKYYADEYFTVMNGYGYTILLQKPAKFTNEELEEFSKIVKTTTYKYNDFYEKKPGGINNILKDEIIGAITAIVISLISVLIAKKKKKNKSNDENNHDYLNNGNNNIVNQTTPPVMNMNQQNNIENQNMSIPSANNQYNGDISNIDTNQQNNKY